MTLCHFPRAPLCAALALALAFTASAASAQAVPAPAAASAPDPAAAPPAEGVLPVVRVHARGDDGATTEHSGSYAPSRVTIGKGERNLREVPNAVTVVTREQLNDQNLVTIEAALKNVTGVTIQRYDASGSYTQFMARGYAADTYLQDGLTVQSDTNGIYFDLAAYDRVEVQRGAASLFSGAGEPGVTVNMVRKRAPVQFQAEGAVMLSRWDDRRAEVDVGGPFNAAGTLRGRAVAVVQDFDTYMDGIDDNRKRLLYGTLEADVSDRTTVSVGATWQRVDTVLSRGLPTFPGGVLIDMPRSTMPVQDWNFQRLDSATAFAEVTHALDNGGEVKAAVRRMQRRNDANYLDVTVPRSDGGMGGGTTPATTLTAAAFEREDIDDSADLYYSQPVRFGGQTHNVLVGADYRDSTATVRYSGSVPLTGAVLNLFDIDHSAISAPAFDLDAGDPSDVAITSYGAYGQLRYKPSADWTLVAGGRWGTWKSSGDSYGTPSNFATHGQFTPYAAALFDVLPSATLYASFNEVFKPQKEVGADGRQIGPRTGEQLELGIKGDLLGRRFVYSAALYQLEDNNRAMPDPNAPAGSTYAIANGKARSRGAEVEVHGALTRALDINAGYAYTDTQLLTAPANQVNTPTSTFTPRHNVNLFLRYRLPAETPVAGLVVGGGLRGVSSFSNGTGANKVTAPGYTVYSLFGTCPINDHLRLSLNVDNLFDKVYWEKVNGPSRQNFFGEPRRVTVALRATY